MWIAAQAASRVPGKANPGSAGNGIFGKAGKFRHRPIQAKKSALATEAGLDLLRTPVSNVKGKGYLEHKYLQMVIAWKVNGGLDPGGIPKGPEKGLLRAWSAKE